LIEPAFKVGLRTEPFVAHGRLLTCESSGVASFLVAALGTGRWETKLALHVVWDSLFNTTHSNPVSTSQCKFLF